MLKINILLIFVLFSYNVFAMDKAVNCNIKIDFEKSTDKNYSFTGYGELKCSDSNSPMTIFSAIMVSEKNAAIKNVSNFTMATTVKNVEVLSYLFQTYEVKNEHNSLVLHYHQNPSLPNLHLHTKLTGDFEGTNNYSTLINLLTGSDLIIEQDYFWEDEI